jgi:cobalt/nickel transport system permease protein
LKHGFLDRYSDLKSPLHSVCPTAKVVVFFALIAFCLSARATAYVSFAGYFAFLLVCLAVSRVPPIHVLRRSLVIVPFMAMAAVSIPFMGRGVHAQGRGPAGVHPGIIVFQGVVIKSYISIFSLVILSSVTRFPHLLGGLRKIGMPRVFLSTMSFTYRYLFLLVEEMERMKRARDARCYGGKWLWQTKVVGRMIGTFFVRSYERAERVYQAMASRGFEGRVAYEQVQPMQAKDYAFLAGALALFLYLRLASVPGWLF